MALFEQYTNFIQIDEPEDLWFSNFSKIFDSAIGILTAQGDKYMKSEHGMKVFRGDYNYFCVAVCIHLKDVYEFILEETMPEARDEALSQLVLDGYITDAHTDREVEELIDERAVEEQYERSYSLYALIEEMLVHRKIAFVGCHNEYDLDMFNEIADERCRYDFIVTPQVRLLSTYEQTKGLFSEDDELCSFFEKEEVSILFEGCVMGLAPKFDHNKYKGDCKCLFQ